MPFCFLLLGFALRPHRNMQEPGREPVSKNGETGKRVKGEVDRFSFPIFPLSPFALFLLLASCFLLAA